MREAQARRLLVWKARHDNGWISVVMEQPDGTFIAWAGPGEVIGVDYVEDGPEHAQAAALFALIGKAAMLRVLPAAPIGSPLIRSQP